MKDFTVQITTQGKLGIFYPETADYNIVLEKVMPFLVKADGSQAKILREISISEKKPSKEDFKFLKFCIEQGWITKGFIEAYQNAKVLAEIYPITKPFLESFESDIETLKDLRRKLE